MKQVGQISAHQFGFIYIGGIPYDPVKVKRFVAKGAGIKLRDIVIFEADESRVLSYIKNAIYMDSVEEKRMVKEFVRASQLEVAKMGTFEGVSADIRKQLSEEGIVITNDGVFMTPADGEGVIMSFDNQIDIDPRVLSILLPDQKRTLSIMLQSSLKIATDMSTEDATVHSTMALALEFTRWADRNSTGILTSQYVLDVLK